jgi:chitinase
MFSFHRLLLIVICLLGTSNGFGVQRRADRPVPKLQVIGYFTEDGAKSGRYTVKNVATGGAAALLTEIDYAFGRVANNRCQIADREAELNHRYTAADSVDGSSDPAEPTALRGTFHQLEELKRLFPQLKVIISFGGWNQSGGFSSAAQPAHVHDFVHSCVDTFIKGHFAPGIEAPDVFDGIDIDWEYPVEGGGGPGKPEDSQHFTAMVAEFRRQLDAVRPGLLLTAALPAEVELYEGIELKKISVYLDQLAIMAYDEHWSNEPLSNFHSALFHDPADPSKSPLDKRYGDYAVQGFLAAGVPREKIVFGVPFYGKGWAGVKDLNHGLYQSAAGPADAISYRDLKAMTAAADRHYFETAATCTLWHQGRFWSYDCPEAMRAKMDYVRRLHLGGVMFWELSQDARDGELLAILAGRE